MASSQGTADYLLSQIATAGKVSARRMFGEYAIYCDDKTVALLCDEQLFVKKLPVVAEFLGPCEEGFPYPGAKPWFVISGERWEDHEWMTQLVKLIAAALPAPKQKTSRKKR
ncbi:TfoX/Sxy family protein [Uliginosibacterium sp. sgz301328]|uniref:TfoX/Sxy family protein n=1 Tax=Uliginosibacterium sp. sgz301328 TaxID=3243764 RepID=UPI00359E2E46